MNDRTDTASVIRERTTRDLIIHDPRKRDTTADNGGEGVNAAGGRAERDPNESLLCGICESEILFFRNHSFMSACAVEVGNIEFDLRESILEKDGDEAFFQNVKAMVYPYGSYRAVFFQGE